MTLQELRSQLFMATTRDADEWTEVTIVTPDGVHHDISGIEVTEDNEGDKVVAFSFTE